ncbi:MAG: IS1182 family transposase [Candidatus Symbiothrix sp.]|jgi:transposase|nr:IS1182 family transposase [Candidatus Symbiothrix sp.]
MFKRNSNFKALKDKDMQGKKTYEETLFLHFQLSSKVPENNFYRRLKAILDLSFVRKLTAGYYGTEGQRSIDPEVFFKLMLIGYIENINSDRKIIEQASMRMDMLYYLGYNIDEALPWHSTLSRTRQLYGEELFLSVFRQILSLCLSEGMVDGRSQAMDSAFLRANASMESLQVQMEVEMNEFYQELSESEKQEQEQPVNHLKLVADDGTKEKDSKTKTKNKGKQNLIYKSTTDPDASISMKKGTKKGLHYYGQISVDTASHVICGAMADLANQRDAQCLPALLGQTKDSLAAHHLEVEEVLADCNYSSGPVLQQLEEEGIKGYIPNLGNYLPARKGFTYVPEGDYYLCQAGKKIPFKNLRTDHRDNSQTKIYTSSVKDCKGCIWSETCIKKEKYKHIEDTIYKPYYDRMHQRMHTRKGKAKRHLRSSTVEPVLGTLLQFRRMRRVNTKGLKLANKHVLLAASAYNIKKLLAFVSSKKTAAVAVAKDTIHSCDTVLNNLLF